MTESLAEAWLPRPERLSVNKDKIEPMAKKPAAATQRKTASAKATTRKAKRKLFPRLPSEPPILFPTEPSTIGVDKIQAAVRRVLEARGA